MYVLLFHTHTHSKVKGHAHIPIIISTAQFRDCYLEGSPRWVERIFYHLCLVDCCKTAENGTPRISKCMVKINQTLTLLCCHENLLHACYLSYNLESFGEN